MLIRILPILLAASALAYGQFGGNATRLRGKQIVSPLTCSDGEGIVWVEANNQFECGTVSGGGGGSGTPNASNTFSSGATTVTVTDNMGTTAKVVNCYIGTAPDYVLLVPNSVQLNSNTVVIGFDAASGDGKCVVNGTGAVAGATVALDNLDTVSINAALIPQTALNLGAQATPWKDLWLYGSGTFGTHSFRLTGTPTGHRVITLPDAAATLLYAGGALGTPASATLTNATGLPIAGITGLGTGVGTLLATPSSANLRAAITDESGIGAALFAGGNIGAATGTSLDLTGGLTTGGATPGECGGGTAGCIQVGQGTAPSAQGTTAIQWIAPTSVTSYRFVMPGAAGDGVLLNSNSSNVVTQSFVGTTGSSSFVRATSPTLVTPALGTPSALVLTNATGLPEAGLTFTDITTANATASQHGLLPKLSNNSSQFLNGQGGWTTPAGGGTGCVPSGSNNNVLTDDGAGACVAESAANITSGALTLGTAGSVVGSVVLANATSGSITVQPATGALGSITLTLPATTGNVPSIAGALAVASGKTFTSSNTLTLTGTDSSSIAFGAGGTVTYTIASGTKALDTDAIASTACDTLATTTATGVASTDTIQITANADVTAVTGYAPVTTGGLQIWAWPTTDTINWKVCNPTSSSVTPGAVTLNYRVVR